jgi:hypothetical protein
MKPRLRFISLLGLLLAAGIYCFSLSSHCRLQREKIALLQRQMADSTQVRAQNQALRKTLLQLDVLDDLRKDHAELFRLRNEIGQLQAATELRKLAAARSAEEQLAQLKTENIRLRDGNQQLVQAPQTLSARQQVDVDELNQIAGALSLYAKMNDNKLPAQFSELRSYSTADVFPTLETNRFEIVYQGNLTNIADPANTPLVRAQAKNLLNQRAYLFADGHLEIRDE